jgi:hypothetical protein
MDLAQEAGRRLLSYSHVGVDRLELGLQAMRKDLLTATLPTSRRDHEFNYTIPPKAFLRSLIGAQS